MLFALLTLVEIVNCVATHTNKALFLGRNGMLVGVSYSEANLTKICRKVRIGNVVYVCIVRILTVTGNVLVVKLGIKLRNAYAVNVVTYLTLDTCNTACCLVESGNNPLAPNVTGTCLNSLVHLVTYTAGTEIDNVFSAVLRSCAVVSRNPIAPGMTGSLLYLVILCAANVAVTNVFIIPYTVGDICFVRDLVPFAPGVTGTLVISCILLTAYGTGTHLAVNSLAGAKTEICLSPITPLVTLALVELDLILATYRAVTDLTVCKLTGVHAEICLGPLIPLVTLVCFNLMVNVRANGTYALELSVNGTVSRALLDVGLIPALLIPCVAGTLAELIFYNVTGSAEASEENVVCTVGNCFGLYLFPLTEVMLKGVAIHKVGLAAKRTVTLILGSNRAVSSALLLIYLIPAVIVPSVAGTLVRLNLVLVTNVAETDLAVNELAGVKADVGRSPLAPLVAGTCFISDIFHTACITDADLSVNSLTGIKTLVSYPLTPCMIGACFLLGLGVKALGANTDIIAKSGAIRRIVGFISKKFPIAEIMSLCRNGKRVKNLTASKALLNLCTCLGTGRLYGNLPISCYVVVGNGVNNVLLCLTALARASHQTAFNTRGLFSNLPLAKSMDMLGLFGLTGCECAYSQNHYCEQA